MSTRTQTNLARKALPTMYDLPSEEIGDAGLPDEYHVHQAVLLNETFKPVGIPADEVFSAIDMNLYYDEDHTSWYKRPDWFGVIGVPRLYDDYDMRWSYVVWDENVVPLIVVELLSPGTEKDDLGKTLRDVNEPPTKWEVYESILRVPYYVVFSRESVELKIFQFKGKGFKEVKNHRGRFWIPQANPGLGLWQGSYHGIEHLWLRWFDAENNWVPTDAEHAGQARQHAGQARQHAEQARQYAEQARQYAEQVRQYAEQERQRAERLAEMLRQLGQNPDQL